MAESGISIVNAAPSASGLQRSHSPGPPSFSHAQPVRSPFFPPFFAFSVMTQSAVVNAAPSASGLVTEIPLSALILTRPARLESLLSSLLCLQRHDPVCCGQCSAICLWTSDRDPTLRPDSHTPSPFRVPSFLPSLPSASRSSLLWSMQRHLPLDYRDPTLHPHSHTPSPFRVPSFLPSVVQQASHGNN